jgi:hypothetical protein
MAKLDIEDDFEIDETDDPFDILLTSQTDPELEPDPEPESANIHFTTCSTVDIEHGMEMTTLLANQVCAYALTGADTHRDRGKKKKHRYLDDQFIGVLIDTKAARVLTASTRQFQAYKSTFGDLLMDATTAGFVSIKFGIGKVSSLGSINLCIPIGIATFYIVLADTLFLLCF